MTKLPRLILISALLIFFWLFSANCSFDAGGCFVTVSGFEGCFESNNLGGTVIRLTDECNRVVKGDLLIGQISDPSFRVYAINGEVITIQSGSVTGEAELIGTSSPIGQTKRITALLATNDTMSLIFENQAPIGPMTRCAPE